MYTNDIESVIKKMIPGSEIHNVEGDPGYAVYYDPNDPKHKRVAYFKWRGRAGTVAESFEGMRALVDKAMLLLTPYYVTKLPELTANEFGFAQWSIADSIWDKLWDAVMDEKIVQRSAGVTIRPHDRQIAEMLASIVAQELAERKTKPFRVHISERLQHVLDRVEEVRKFAIYEN